jgi:hypothetical protein
MEAAHIRGSDCQLLLQGIFLNECVPSESLEQSVSWPHSIDNHFGIYGHSKDPVN